MLEANRAAPSAPDRQQQGHRARRGGRTEGYRGLLDSDRVASSAAPTVTPWYAAWRFASTYERCRSILAGALEEQAVGLNVAVASVDLPCRDPGRPVVVGLLSDDRLRPHGPGEERPDPTPDQEGERIVLEHRLGLRLSAPRPRSDGSKSGTSVLTLLN